MDLAEQVAVGSVAAHAVSGIWILPSRSPSGA
jgi:hypothetical protein